MLFRPPGVLSARWSGPPKSDRRNNELLLAQLADVPDERRGAHFVASVAFCLPDGTEQAVEGRMDGRVLRAPQGEGGFGYDPIFYVPELGKTAAELSKDEKRAVSHRGKALNLLLDAMKNG